MTQQLLEAPVLVGEMTLAPTTELAGLAELAGLTSLDARIDALARIAVAIRDEDEVRDHVASLRNRDELAPLPRRR
jgi:hypothetical protein